MDGLWYDIHGAMTVEGTDDAESRLLTRIRETVGPTTLISTSMDLHGNVSRDLVHQSDLITCYRMAPHEDAMDTKERAARNLVDLLTSGAPARSRPGSRSPYCSRANRPPPASNRRRASTRPLRT